MGKVIRLSDRNEQHMEDLRQLFAKVKFTQNIEWTDEQVINMALCSTIIDMKQRLEKE